LLKKKKIVSKIFLTEKKIVEKNVVKKYLGKKMFSKKINKQSSPASTPVYRLCPWSMVTIPMKKKKELIKYNNY